MTERILVVDDYEPWRQRLCSVLRKSRRWKIVGEAPDALEAIQQAEALRPDLILLDVELPTLSGIEAARRILARDPSSRILFVSAHRSLDIVEAAMRTGARGYIVKSDSEFELLPAMETIVKGQRFVGAMLTGRTFDSGQDDGPTRHEAGFYSEDTFLLDAYVHFAKAALDAGKAFIVVAGETRRTELRQRLQALGLDIDLAIKQRRYISLDIADVLSAVMVDGWPDEARFWKAGTSLIFEAARASRGEYPLVAACGDGAASLLSDGKAEAAIRFEQLWDELAAAYNVDVFCGYRQQVHRHDDERASSSGSVSGTPPFIHDNCGCSARKAISTAGPAPVTAEVHPGMNRGAAVRLRLD